MFEAIISSDSTLDVECEVLEWVKVFNDDEIGTNAL